MDSAIIEQFVDGGAVSISTLAKSFEIARETVRTRLISAGVRPSSESKRHTPLYPLIPSIIALRNADRRGTTGALTEEEACALSPSDRAKWFESERLRVAVAKEKGNLVDVEDARQQIAETVKLQNAVFESLPDTLERKHRLSPAVIADIEETCDIVRNQFAEKLKNL